MQRKRETSGERYKRVIRQRRIFLLSVFLIVIALCICLFTPLFGITEITVSGNAVLSSEEIITASGIEKGENVFRIPKSKTVKALTAIAYVEGAEIKRKFPAKVEIVIDEAKPDIIIDTPTQFVVTNIGGRVLELTEDVTHLTSPIVYGMEITEATPADTIKPADAERFSMYIEQIKCFYDTDHWANIDEFYLSDVSEFTMVMKAGTRVTFGTVDSLESLQRKIKMMTKIFEQVEQTERSYLDLTTDKGYYGEYTDAELEAMKNPENDILTEESAEETESQEPVEETSPRQKGTANTGNQDAEKDE